MTPCLKWLLRARPADYALALSVAGASLPVVGKHLEPLGGVTAMGVWGARQAPEAFSALKKGWLTPGINDARRRDRESRLQRGWGRARQSRAQPAARRPDLLAANIPENCFALPAPLLALQKLSSVYASVRPDVDLWINI